MNINKAILTLCFCVFVVNFNLLAEDPAIISLKPECRTFYADREHTLTILTESAAGEALSWNLRYAGRTLAAGKRNIPQNGEVKIAFKFPKLNPGVIAGTEFNCWVGKQALGTRHQALGKNEERGRKSEDGDQSRKEGREHPTSNIERSTSNVNKGKELRQSNKIRRSNIIRRSLYFFYPNPFEGQKKALKERQIGVWETTEGGTLSALLKSLEVPFAEVADPIQFNGQILLVTGIDFDSSPGALDALLELTKKGKKVIIMPPISGKFTLDVDKFDGIVLGGKEYIIGGNNFGVPPLGGLGSSSIPPKGGTPNRKKFDTESWNGKTIAQTRFNLIPSGETIELEFNKANKGFTYCELRKEKGKVIITTWDIINGAKISPTPVYLFKILIMNSIDY